MTDVFTALECDVFELNTLDLIKLIKSRESFAEEVLKLKQVTQGYEGSGIYGCIAASEKDVKVITYGIC